MQKSYCYTPSVRVRVSVGVRMQYVRAYVKVMKFQSLCIFSCFLTFVIILIKPSTTKAHNRRAFGDCGTSGQDKVTIQELITFSNKRMFSCFNSKGKLSIIFCFCIFTRLLTSTETHNMLADMVRLLKVTLICVQNIQNVIRIFMISYAKMQLCRIRVCITQLFSDNDCIIW